MAISIGVVVRVSPEVFPQLLAANIDLGQALLTPAKERFEGSFLERPLRANAADLPGALRALGLPPDSRVASSRPIDGRFEVLLEGRLGAAATIDAALRALEREREDATFTVHRDAGELRVTGTVSPWALNGWRETLLAIFAAGHHLGGTVHAGFLADADTFEENPIAERYVVEGGALVIEDRDPPNDGFDATLEAFEPCGVTVSEA